MSKLLHYTCTHTPHLLPTVLYVPAQCLVPFTLLTITDNYNPSFCMPTAVHNIPRHTTPAFISSEKLKYVNLTYLQSI